MSLTDYVGIAVLGLVVIAAFSVVFAWVFARLYCRPRRRPLTQTPADHHLAYTPLTLASRGVYLEGWFIAPKINHVPQPTIILAHGWSNTRAQMLPLARPLHEAGFGVLLYDARGHGASGGDGPMTIRKIAEDVVAAMDYLEGRPEVDARRVGVVGHSIGGAGAILAASYEPRIRALVSSSAFADPVALTLSFLRALHIPRWPFLWLVCRFIERWLGVSMEEAAPLNHIGRISVPILLIHGEDDRFVPPSNMDALYGQADAGKTRRWLVPGRHHSNTMQDPDFASVVIEFLAEHLTDDRSRNTGPEPERHMASPIYAEAILAESVTSNINVG